ncbi:MAG: TRADD-N-associated membrane domain-containing protein [Delftia tsuruhatensis]
MLFETYFRLFELLEQAWKQNKNHDRSILILSGLGIIASAAAILANKLEWLDDDYFHILVSVLGGIAFGLALFVAGLQSTENKVKTEKKLEKAKEDVHKYPEKPQLAWDLARVKLESYLDRNLNQVNSIYWLTLFVMSCGFSLTGYGVYQAFQDPEKLPVSIVSAASGVIITFIGGTFLIIYKSTLAQSREYVTVLERINAVGMAVQVISTIAENNTELKSQTQAELAKSLLSMYAASSRSTTSDN